MPYMRERKLKNLLPLLIQLDQGKPLEDTQQEELDAIHYLDAWFHDGPLPNSISKLKNLETLSLSGAHIDDLTPIAGLANLHTLQLDSTHISNLTPLLSMRSLQKLVLSGTPLRELPSLSCLSNLQSLHLSNTKVSDLTPLLGLQNLQTLDLSGTQVCDLDPLSSLHNLQKLDLSNTQVSNLTPLSGLQHLQELHLRGTKVDNLTPLSNLHNLETLGLSNSKVRELTPLNRLKLLNRLNLEELNLQAIPKALFDLNLSWVFKLNLAKDNYIALRGATLSTQPISLFHQDRKVIQTYYDAEKVDIREAKVIFLGDGGAGKTHTIKRILNKDIDKNINTQTTLGIYIEEYSAKGENGDFNINFWDFGGQENMHAMHRCFLTDRTCYVVVISNRHNNLDDRARYWLDNIRSFAPKVPVILAVNKWEGISACPMDTNRLYQDYSNLYITYYTAKGGSRESFSENLTKAIIHHAEDLDSNAMQLPRDWAAIRQELVNIADSSTWYINQDDYYNICKKHGLDKDEDAPIRAWLLDWFNDLGICFSHHEEQSQYNVLNPRWLTNAIYILLNSNKKYNTNGVMSAGNIELLLQYPTTDKLSYDDPRDDIPDYMLKRKCYDRDTGEAIWEPISYKPEEQQHILAVMRKFELSYPISNTEEFIPALCNGDMPKDLYPTQYKSRISYEIRYSFLPDSLVQRLMVRLLPHRQFSALWRKGFRFEETNLTAVVDTGSPNNILRIDVFSRKSNAGKDTVMELVAQLRDLQQIMGIISEEFIIVHGPRGEIPVPADMVLLAWEQNIPQLHLYSKENGLIAESPATILGEAYSPEILDKAKQLVQMRRCTAPEAASQIIHNHYYGNVHHGDHIEGDKVEGDKYTQVIPENLVTVLEKLIDENYQTNQDFIDHLLEQLEACDEQVSREIARDAKADPKKKRNILGTLRKTASGVGGAASFLADSPEAIKTLTAIATAVSTAATQYGPEIAEFLSKFPILPI